MSCYSLQQMLQQSSASPSPKQLAAGSYLCAFPDGEFLTLGLLECIDRSPEHSHTHRWALVKFLWGAGCHGQLCSTFCHTRLSVLSVCLPFSFLFLSAFARGTSLLPLQHSPDACLLPLRGSLASPGPRCVRPPPHRKKTEDR